MFEIRRFYDKNYTDFCATIGPKIRLLFDLLVGYSYEEANELKTIDENTIEFKGSAKSILKLYDKIMNCPLDVECDTSRDDIVGAQKLVSSPYQRFIIEGGCNMSKDLSKIKVRFHKK